MSSLDWILKEKLVAILRGVDPEHLQVVVDALYAGGITVVELTLNSADALPQIAKLAARYENRMLIGAGTVLDLSDVKGAADAGARFIISPGFDEEVVKFTLQKNLVSIPGAYTPTEIMRAYKAGADIVKIFPVNNAEYVKSVAAPLNKVRMMPTGGINTFNIQEFNSAGAVAFGIGSALVHKTARVDDAYLDNIISKAKALKTAVASF